LVKRTDAEIQALVMEALSRTPMPVTFCGWNYVEQLGETQLIIATPWYDSKGPRTATSALIDALQGAGVYEEIPLRRVYLKSPTDPLVKMLEREAKEAPEGFLNLLHNKDGSYSVVFAPLSGSGSPVPARHFSGKGEAEEFLSELQLSPRTVEEAFLEAARHGIGTMGARFAPSQLRRWGLAPPRGQAKIRHSSRRGTKSYGNGNGSGNPHRQSRGNHRARRGGSV
jgi:hypothetical protein